MSRFHDRGLEPPETTRLDRVSIVSAETYFDEWTRQKLLEEEKDEDNDKNPYSRTKARMAIRCAEELVGTMVEKDLILYREFANEQEHQFTIQMEAIVIDGNHAVMRDAYKMANEVIREMREERLLHNVDDIALENKIAEKLAEILHNEKDYE